MQQDIAQTERILEGVAKKEGRPFFRTVRSPGKSQGRDMTLIQWRNQASHARPRIVTAEMPILKEFRANQVKQDPR